MTVMKTQAEQRTKTISRVTIGGALANVALAVIKLIAGLLGHSSAMVADAIHSFSDLVSDVVVLVMVRVAGKGKDKGHDYGHGKFETLATAIVALMLLVVGGKMLFDGVEKILSVVRGGSLQSPSTIALWAALVSILVKELLYQWTARVAKKVNSPAMLTNAWHHRTDALSSIGAALGIGAAILLGGQWTVLDPAVGCLISVVILIVAVRMVLPALAELTDGSLSDEIEQKIESAIFSVDGIEKVKRLYTRQNGPHFMIEAIVEVDPDLSVRQAHSIVDKAEEELRQTFGAETHISIHVEPSAK